MILAAGAITGILIGLSSPVSAQSTVLPSGWSTADIGDPNMAGAASHEGGVFTVTGSGYDIWGTTDEFRFAYQRVTGDTQITARVTSLEGAHAWSKAGIMIRGALTGPSAHAMLVASVAKGWAFQRRPLDGALSVNTSHAGAAPGWMRLVRKGEVLSAYLSDDGARWSLIESETVAMGATIYVGLAVTSHHSYATATASFSDVSVTGTTSGSLSPAVPAPWATRDLGGPALAGAAAVANGTFSVTGAGFDVWGSSDEFRFLYQRVTGDTQIVARVASLEGSHAWSKAGVMIRGELTGSSPHAALFASSDKGWAFQRRQYDGGLSTHTPRTGSAPGWIRLVREGQLISTYHSPDGGDWSLVGADTVPMGDTVYIGLAVTSHNVGATATANFTNVVVGGPAAGNRAPSVAITTPSPSATYTAPATIAVGASASDTDGLVTGVTFLANNVLIGTSSSAPFAISWPNVPAGTYSLTAVANDNGGDSATSAPILITVAAAGTPALPTRIAFTASADHATSVTSYAVQIRRATDAVTAVPVAARELGKPAPVDGEITADISTLVDPLSPGSYYAVVVAAGPGGSAASTPSAAFAK